MKRFLDSLNLDNFQETFSAFPASATSRGVALILYAFSCETEELMEIRQSTD